MARRGRNQRIYRIGVAESRIIKAGRDRISGILRYAAMRGNWEVRLLRESGMTRTANEMNQAQALDGIIGGPVRVQKALGSWECPFVAIDAKNYEPRGECPAATVAIDDEAVGRAAAGIFLRGGLRHIAFVGVGHRYEAMFQNGRLDSLRKCAEEADATFSAFLPDIGDAQYDDIEDLAEWLAALPHPCGVMAYSDNRAQTVLDACRMAHVKVPDQIQLVGVDNEVEICENMQPTLTSILPDFEGGGYLAAQLMDEMLTRRYRRRTPKTVTYGVKSVVVRASTQDLMGGGRLVTLAREFIRLHAGEQVDVEDIAAALNVSRRTLERRFREVTGMGVADALRQERLARVCRLLAETDRTIADISYDSGFASHNYIKALFKRTHGMTMGEWRASRGRNPKQAHRTSGLKS